MRAGIQRLVLLACVAGVLAPAGAQATFPGANGEIAFLCLRYDNLLHVCAIPPEGGSHRTAAGLAGNVTSAPRWSPNGRHILYQFETPEWGLIRTPGLHSIRGTEGHTEPAWSPRGDRIAAVRYTKRPRGIFVFRVNGRGRRLLVRNAAQPDWSPNGRTIAFARQRDIYLYDLARRTIRRVTRSPAGTVSRFPSWSPNGRQLAFARIGGSGENSTSNIFVIGANGRNERQVTFNPTRGRVGGDIDPAWSPDGRFIAFIHGPGGNSGGFSLDVIGVDGTGQRTLIAPPTFVSMFAPDWGRRR